MLPLRSPRRGIRSASSTSIPGSGPSHAIWKTGKRRAAGGALRCLRPLMQCSRATLWTHCRSRRSEEHTSELQSLMRISYAVFCLKKKNNLSIILSPSYYHFHTNPSTTLLHIHLTYTHTYHSHLICYIILSIPSY